MIFFQPPTETSQNMSATLNITVYLMTILFYFSSTDSIMLNGGGTNDCRLSPGLGSDTSDYPRSTPSPRDVENDTKVNFAKMNTDKTLISFRVVHSQKMKAF